MTNPRNAPFGSVLAGTMAVAHYRDGAWGKTEFRVTGPLEIHPAAHALHYGSECFEGFKAYKHADGSVNVFRLDMHLARMQNSARALVLPEPDPAQLRAAVLELIARHVPAETPIILGPTDLAAQLAWLGVQG